MKLTKKDLNEIAIWVGALRSGLFEQTTQSLQDNQGYCCLGVACELFVADEIKNYDNFDQSILSGGTPENQPRSTNWLNFINEDVERKTGSSLINYNDNRRKSFKQIAKIIENTYLK